MITFAEILKDKGYPGFDRVKHIDAPWVSDQLSLFKPEDEARFWFKGFQWPRAYPLNFVWLEDGFAWGTQAAARNMPLPPSDGLAPRVAGIFVYGSDIPGHALDCRKPCRARAGRAAAIPAEFSSDLGRASQ